MLAFLINQQFGDIKIIYNFNTILMPVILIAFAAVLLAIAARGRKDKALVQTACICLAAGFVLAGLRVYCTHIEPHQLRLREVTIQTDKVDRQLRILHITDIQANTIGAYEEKVFERIRELRPDLVLHTGDLLQTLKPASVDEELGKLASWLNTLKPPLGIFSVYGDVDWRLFNVPKEKLGGMNMLNNKEAIISAGNTRLRLFGMSCPESKDESGFSHSVRTWLDQTGSNDFTIVLGHAPDYALAVQALPIDLCLAGHTHGGQIRVPCFGPIVTLSDVPRAWARGFREIGKTRLNVSAGVGCEHKDGVPPIRFNCPSEMTLITLVPRMRDVGCGMRDEKYERDAEK